MIVHKASFSVKLSQTEQQVKNKKNYYDFIILYFYIYQLEKKLRFQKNHSHFLVPNRWRCKMRRAAYVKIEIKIYIELDSKSIQKILKK